MAWSDTTRKAEASIENAASLSVVLNSTVAGSCIVVAGSHWRSTGGASTTVTISDNVNGTYTHVTGSPLVVGIVGACLAYFANNAGGNLTVTLDPTGGTDAHDLALDVHEFAGGLTSSPLDQAATASGASGTSASVGAVTPGTAAGLALAVIDPDGYGSTTENAGSEGFTLSNENEGAPGQPISFVFKILSGTPSTSHSWTKPSGAAWTALLAVLKPSGAGGQSVVPVLECQYRARRG
jgi:hypothetical protein